MGEILKKTENTQEKENEKKMILISEEEFEGQITNIPHKKTVMHFLCLPEYAKVQLFGSCIVGTVFIPDRDVPSGAKVRLGFYISEDFLYIIGDESYTVPLAGRMKDTKFSEDMTLCGLFCRILNLLIDEDVRFLQKTEKNLAVLEDSLNHGTDDEFDSKIMPYRRQMMNFQSYYYQLMNLGMTFRSNINQMLCEEDIMNFTYYTRRAEMLHVQVQAIRDYIFHIRETYRTDIALRQSRSMNMLTVMSAVFMPLTLIAGWYGMNFESMPELSSPFGYPAVIAVSAVIVIAEILFFRKKNLF